VLCLGSPSIMKVLEHYPIQLPVGRIKREFINRAVHLKHADIKCSHFVISIQLVYHTRHIVN
jgi:hypothetical protein